MLIIEGGVAYLISRRIGMHWLANKAVNQSVASLPLVTASVGLS